MCRLSKQAPRLVVIPDEEGVIVSPGVGQELGDELALELGQGFFDRPLGREGGHGCTSSGPAGALTARQARYVPAGACPEITMISLLASPLPGHLIDVGLLQPANRLEETLGIDKTIRVIRIARFVLGMHPELRCV